MPRKPSGEVISGRALNRAALARQMLLAREKTTAVKAVERVLGLQAQLARPPFVGLWTRVAAFEREELAKAIAKRAVVRATMMRCTLHLVSAKDYLALRGAIQPALSQAARAVLKDRVKGIDVERVVGAARKLFEAKPRTFEEARDALAEEFPKNDARAMGYVVRNYLPLVQVPAEGAAWAYPGAADFAVAAKWIGSEIPLEEKVEPLVMRYLAAFGPANAKDMQTWSGVPLPVLKAAFDAVRDQLVVFEDARGREVFDVPKGERPGEDAEAPVRYLPEYDSVVLAWDDRTRLVEEEHRKRLFRPNLIVPPVFLVDGMIAGTWKLEVKKKRAKLALEVFTKLAKKTRAELEGEGERLAKFVEPEAIGFDFEA